MGHIKCNKISCPVLDCEVKQSLTSECCPVCTGECLGSNDKIYKPNETWKEDDDDCIECKCVDGQKVCITESCNPSSCSNAVKTSGVCCPTCPNQNCNLNILSLFNIFTKWSNLRYSPRLFKVSTAL